MEDFKRYQADNTVNAALTNCIKGWRNTNFSNDVKDKPPQSSKTIFQKKPHERVHPTNEANPQGQEPLKDSWIQREWQNLRGICNSQVGDFVKLHNHDSIPADIVILSTSEPDCTAFVETKNLDGETNLKIKRGIPDLSFLKTAEGCKHFKGYIDAEAPNPNLYTFNGCLSLIDIVKSEELTYPIGPNGILLRGCTLRDTEWLIGVVLYTGIDTKIILNSGPTPSKRSKVDKQTNPQILLNSVILFTLSGTCAVVAGLYQGTFLYQLPPYVGTTHIDSVYSTATFTFINCLIIFQNIIPIALVISLEISKSIQVSWFN